MHKMDFKKEMDAHGAGSNEKNYLDCTIGSSKSPEDTSVCVVYVKFILSNSWLFNGHVATKDADMRQVMWFVRHSNRVIFPGSAVYGNLFLTYTAYRMVWPQ